MSGRHGLGAKGDHAVFDEDWQLEPSTGVRTPLPPFDLAAFAADSECRLLARAEAEKKSTAPPPAYHPSLIPSAPAEAKGAERASGSGATESATLQSECARRARLVSAQLRIGGMSREEAARALGAELDRVAEEGVSEGLRALGSSLSAAVGELGGVGEEKSRAERSVLVLEDDVDVRDRLTIALEALGHRVRGATKCEVLTELAAHDTSAVVVGVDAGSESTGWRILRDLLPIEGVAIIVGGKGAGPGLETLAAEAGADDFLRFDLGIPELIDELATIFSALGLTRPMDLLG